MGHSRSESTVRESRSSRIVLAATIMLLVVPVLVDLAFCSTSAQKRLFAYAAPDTFYYLTVARSIGLHGQFSFDGEHLSNGYHPLWQVLTAIPYALHFPGANTPWILAYLLGMALMLQSATLALWSRIFRRADETLSWLFVGLPAGVYSTLICPVWLQRTPEQLNQANLGEGAQPVYGSLWNYLNGMETSLVLFFFACLSWLITQERPLERPIAIGLTAAGLVFARLDHGLVVLPILIGVSLAHMRQSKPWRERLKAPAITGLVFASPLLVYLLLNHFFVGSAVPTSGRLKSTFPLITIENFDVLRKLYNSIVTAQPVKFDDYWRVMQLIVPAAFAFFTPFVVTRVRIRHGRVLITWAAPNARRGALLLMTAAGVLCLCAYNFLFVYVYGIGHWYFPVSTLFISLVCLHAAERIRNAWLERAKRREPTARSIAMARIARYAIPAITVAFTAILFVLFHRNKNYHERYAHFAIDHGPEIREFLQAQNAKIIDCDDGIVAWVSDVPAMSGTGLGLDPDAARVRGSKFGLMPMAIARQYTYAATLVYVDNSKLINHSPKEVLAWMTSTGAFTQLGNLKEYAWKIAYRTPDRDFAIVHATPLVNATNR
jgi:hypothetical protein